MDTKQKRRAVIEFLLSEVCEGDDIVLRLQHGYGRDAYYQTSVFRWMTERRPGNEELRNEGRPRRPHYYETDAALRSVVRDDPNASLRTIADMLSVSSETICIHMSRIGHALNSLRWIPHPLTSELKQICFDLSLELLPKLRAHAHAHDNWRHLGTGDQSWFYYEYVRDRIWITPGENTPEVENRIAASTKTMLTVLWNPDDFHVTTMLPLGELFHASWFIDQNLVPLVQSFFPSGWSPRQND
jgi:hypothetical protein